MKKIRSISDIKSLAGKVDHVLTLFSGGLDSTYILRPQHNVTSEAKTRQKMAQKRSLLGVNEHFKPFFNDVLAILVVMLRSHFGSAKT